MSTVAIYGATGNLGKSALPHFIKFHNENKLKLVILHRPGSNIASLNLPSSIETRAIDLEKDEPASAYVDIVKDIDIVVPTAMAFGAENVLFKLFEALGQTGKTTLAFDPFFGAQARGDLYPELAFFQEVQGTFKNKAAEFGVKLVKVRAGLFSSWFFDMGFTEASAKSNSVVVNESQLKNKFPIVSTDYLGAVLAELSVRPREEIAGKVFSAIEKWVTGDEIVKALESVNGTRPEIKGWARPEFEQALGEQPMGSVKALYLQQWADQSYEYPNEVTLDGWKTLDVAESFRAVKA